MKIKTLRMILLLSFLLTNCSKSDKSTDNNNNDLQCSGEYAFTITDTLNRHSLPDMEYLPDNSGRTYCLTFSSKKDSVFIRIDSGFGFFEADTLVGVIDTIKNDSRIYVIVSFFTGGCMTIWPDTLPLYVAYTLYGSGLPFIWSEKGNLLWQD